MPAGPRLLAGALALTLSACAPSASGVWSKEGVAPAQVKGDQRACVAQAGDYGFLVPSPAQGGGSTVATRQEGDIYRACMARKGYSEYAPGSLPQAKPEESQ